LRRVLAAPGFCVAWKKWRFNFGSDFADAIDRIVAQARASGWEEPSASWASDVAEEMRLRAK
jgi:hypothetical protein